MLAYAATNSKSNPSGAAPSKTLRLFALYENMTRFVLPLCSAIPKRPNPETPVDQSNNIVDISKVGLKQFWNLRSHMQDASTLATAHYPETLDRIFVILPFQQLGSSMNQRRSFTDTRLRSSAPLRFFLRSGAGSRNGSTLSPLPKYSFWGPTRSNPPCPPSSMWPISPENMGASWTLNAA